MSILNYEEMTLESDTFQAARETFNLMMQKLFRKMEQSDMDEGSIDLKIIIRLNVSLAAWNVSLSSVISS